MAKKLFIFDYDGVIADSLGNCIEIINSKGAEYNLQGRLTPQIIGTFPHVTMDTALRYMGMEEKEILTRGLEILDCLQKNALVVPLFSGLDKLFKLICSMGNIIAINTANSSKTVYRRLENALLISYISHIEGADIKGSKSEKILKIMEKFHMDAENTYMIGDTMGDITEGHKAGVHTIAVTYGWQTKQTLEKVQPQHFCTTTQELLEYIKTR